MVSLPLCLVFFVAAVQALPTTPSGCEIEYTVFNDFTPLILYYGGNNNGLIYPENKDYKIRLAVDQTVRLACTRNQESRRPNTLDIKTWDQKDPRPMVKDSNKEKIILKCKGGNKFNIEAESVKSNGNKGKGQKDNTEYTFNQFVCKDVSRSVIKQKIDPKTKKPILCTRGGTAIQEIKFELSDAENHVVLEYCRHKTTTAVFTAWAHSIIHPWTPPFRSEGSQKWSNYDASSSVYENKMFLEQKEGLAHSLGLRKDAVPISEKLERGHLVARADMYYPTERIATYDYANSIPQWQSINGGNWREIEISVRNLATTQNNDLLVWTGAVGNMQYGKKNLYLNHDGSSAKAKVPIPEHIFKIVYDDKAKKGVAIVTIHNPFLKENEVKSLIKCTDVSNNIPKMKNRRYQDIKQGYTFCCEISDFMKYLTASGLILPGVPMTPTTLLKF